MSLYNNTMDELKRAYFLHSSEKIIGASWDLHQTRWWIPVGLEKFNDPANPPPSYASPFFGASRAWKNEEEGWQVISYKKKKSSRPKAHFYYEDI
jgi:hypothetical protein